MSINPTTGAQKERFLGNFRSYDLPIRSAVKILSEHGYGVQLEDLPGQPPSSDRFSVFASTSTDREIFEKVKALPELSALSLMLNGNFDWTRNIERHLLKTKWGKGMQRRILGTHRLLVSRESEASAEDYRVNTDIPIAEEMRLQMSKTHKKNAIEGEKKANELLGRNKPLSPRGTQRIVRSIVTRFLSVEPNT